MKSSDDTVDLCIVTVSHRTSGPPRLGARCSASNDDIAAATLSMICDLVDVEPEQIRGRSRDPQFVAARWAWWVLLRDYNMSYSRIAKLVNRDHSSVIYGLERAATCERTQAVLDAVRRS